MTALGIAILAVLAGASCFVMITALAGRPVFGTLMGRRSPARPAHRSTRRAVGSIASALLVFVLTGWLGAAGLVGVAVWGLPRFLESKAARDSSIARTEAIAAWTEMVRDSIAAASGLEEAIVATSSIAPLPVRGEVARLVRRLDHHPLAEALAVFGNEMAHPSADLVVAALTIAAQMEASDLTGLLSRLADAIRDDARMRIRVQVGRARVRTATKVIVGVVALTILLLALLNRQYLAAYDSAAGQVVLVAVGGIFAAGGWLLTRMSDLELPERFSARSAAGSLR